MNKLKEILIEFGFANAEIEVYFALLKLGEAKVGEIIRLSSISSSNTHDCLDKLLKKGVISYILKNKIKHFYPTKPENLKLLIKEQKDRLEKNEKDLDEIIPELYSLANKEVISQGAEIFFGFPGLKNAFKKLTDPIIDNEFAYFFYKVEPEVVDLIHKFYSKLELDGDYNDFKQIGIASRDYEEYFGKRNNSKVQIKYTNLPIPYSVNFYSDKTLLISWSKDPVAFLIKSKQITNTFRKLFDEIWEKS